MTETTTHPPAIDTIAEAARLTEYLRAMQQQAAKVETLAREAYTDQTQQTSPFALARIAVLEAENATQREQIIRLTPPPSTTAQSRQRGLAGRLTTHDLITII